MTPQTLAQVHAAAFTDGRPWRADEFAALLDSTGVILLGDARSFLLARLIAGEAEVLTVATRPDFQRQGLARANLAAFLNTLKDQDAACAFLEVAADNSPAKSLYQKEGFLEIARRPDYYARPDGAKTAAVIMRCDL